MKKIRIATVVTVLIALFSSCKKEEPQDDGLGQYMDTEEITVNKPAFAAQGYEIPIKASGNVKWTADVQDGPVEWLELENHEGQGDGTLIFSLTENSLTNIRKATVSVCATGENGYEAVKKINISQLGSDPSILISPEGVQNYPSDAVDAVMFDVTANVEWNAALEILSGEGQWIEIVSQNMEEDRTGTVELKLTANDTPYARSAKLVVNEVDGMISVEVTVQQDGSRVKLSIPGMSGYLPEGVAMMNITGEDPVELEISEDGTGTVLYFDNRLPAGEYVVENIVSGENSYVMDASIKVVSAQEVICLEPWEASLSLFGGSSEKYPLKISGYEVLSRIMENVNGGNSYSGKYFLQTRDIHMPDDSEWPGIGLEANPFSGNYDGGGFGIYGMKIKAEGMAQKALFNCVRGAAGNYAEVKNVVIQGDENESTYEIECGGGYVSAVVALASDYSRIAGCRNYADIRSGENSSGGTNKTAGVVAYASGKSVLIDGCENYGHIYAVNSNGKIHDCGGVIGVAVAPSYEDRVVIQHCRNYGKCEFSGNTGGVLGSIDENVELLYCTNYGNLSNTSGGMRFGGVVGNVDLSADGIARIAECINLGHIKGTGGNQGGVVGVILNNTTVENCYNKGTVEVPGNNTNNAGVVAHVNTAKGHVVNCYNAGSLAATDGKTNLGAVVGMNTEGNIICVSGCYYESGLGFTKGAGKNQDTDGVVTSLSSSEIMTGDPFAGWDASIWKFTDGGYPSLINNPE